jgi:hypothetical protein
MWSPFVFKRQQSSLITQETTVLPFYREKGELIKSRPRKEKIMFFWKRSSKEKKREDELLELTKADGFILNQYFHQAWEKITSPPDVPLSFSNLALICLGRNTPEDIFNQCIEKISSEDVKDLKDISNFISNAKEQNLSDYRLKRLLEAIVAASDKSIGVLIPEILRATLNTFGDTIGMKTLVYLFKCYDKYVCDKGDYAYGTLRSEIRKLARRDLVQFQLEALSYIEELTNQQLVELLSL